MKTNCDVCLWYIVEHILKNDAQHMHFTELAFIPYLNSCQI